MAGDRDKTRGLRLWVVLCALALGAASTGCGDDGDGSGDAGIPSDGGNLADSATPDGGTPADAGPAQDATVDGGAPPPCAHTRLLVTTGDFVTGGLGTVDVMTGAVATAPGDAADQDSVPGLAGCAPLVLERSLGVVRVQDASDPLMTLHSADVNPTGAMGPYAANPQKVVEVAPDELWVVLGATPAIAVIDPTMDGAAAVIDTIDLSGLVKPGDMDGNVDAADAVFVDGRVYVALGNYWFDDAFTIHFEGSELAVIDASTRQLVDVDPAVPGVQAIDLAGENPWRGLWPDAASGTLVVGAAGDSFALDGQLEVVDLATNASSSTVVTEAQLGGEINGFAYASPTRLVVLAGARLVAFDPSVGLTTPDLLFDGADGMLLSEDRVWVWTRMGAAAGLRAIDPMDGSDVTPGGGPITVGSLPVSGVVPSP